MSNSSPADAMNSDEVSSTPSDHGRVGSAIGARYARQTSGDETELLRLFPGKRWLAPLFRIPGVLPLARRIYAWIARRRHCLVRGFPPR